MAIDLNKLLKILEDEVGHACAYLAIERARLGEERVEVKVELPAALTKLRVPPLLLQPLVENAIKHGLARRDGTGRVTLRARLEGSSLLIEVEDEASGRRLPPMESGNGIALETLRRRLSRQYGEHASLELSPTERGMRATVRLPVEQGQLIERAA